MPSASVYPPTLSNGVTHTSALCDWNSEYAQGKVFDGESIVDGTVYRLAAMARRGTLSTAAIGITDMVEEDDVVKN